MPVNIGTARTRFLNNDQDGDGQADTGDQYTYELIITNSGDTAATNVQIDATENGYTIGGVLMGPIGVDDTVGVTVAGNTPYTFTHASLTGNDLDPDDASPTLSITHVNGTAITVGVPIDIGNGTVTDNGDATFTFRPDAGFEGQVTFTYNTVDSDGVASVAATPATVTINVGDAVWYVNSAVGNDATGDGTYENPFASLNPITTGGTSDALDDSNDTVFVYANGANAYNSGIVLEQGQVLRGEGVAADYIVNGITISSSGTDTQLEYTTFGVELNTGNTIVGIDFVGEATGAVAIRDGGVSAGTLNVSDVEVSGQGQIIDVDQGGTLNVTLQSAASTGSTGANGGVIDIGGTGTTTGTFTVSGTTSITGSHAQTGIDIGAAGTNLVNTFTGFTTVNTGAGGGAGVNLSTNTGSTSFAGLDVDTTNGAGVTANSAGTLSITGAVNSITSTSATALNVTNTTIGASDLTFQSISSGNNTAAGEPVNGIVLNNTGTSGGLTVTGSDGGDAGTVPDDGSGGTIQNTSGDGILLTNTMDVFLNGMTLSGNDGDGIGGSGINGFVLDNVDISGSGTTDASDHSGINIANLTGTVFGGLHSTEIRNSTISNNHEFEIQITNSSGTLTDFRITNSTISSNGGTGVHGNLVNFLSTGSATMALTVAGSSFTGNQVAGALTGTGVNVDGNGGVLSATIGSSTFTNNNVGINVSAATTTTLSFNLNGNTVTGSTGNAINFFTNANHTGTASGTIANNTVGTQGVAGSGSTLGRGIRASNEGTGTTTLNITGNTIQSIADFDGLFVFKGVSRGTMNATITNNLFRDIPGDRGITIQTGTVGSVINSNISGNQFVNVVGISGTVMRLFEGPPATPGTLNVSQADVTALSTANNGAAITVSGTPQFGQPAPPLPLLAEGVPDAPDQTPPAGGDTPDEPVAPGDGPDAPAGDGGTEPPAPEHPVIVDDAVLSQAELDYLVDAAIERWIAAGASEAQVAAMREATFTVADMSANYLASSQPGTVVVDSDGAGHGWFLDGTPGDDAEYQGSGTLLTATGGEAAGRMDLLTVLMHELGHQVGLGDIYATSEADELMYGYASLGARRLPAGDDLAAADPDHAAHEAFVLLTPTITTLPAGRAVRVVYTATIRDYQSEVIGNPFSNNVTISGGNFANVVSANDATTVDSLTLGGTVWNDDGAGGGTATNGVRDGTEAGVVGVAVTLFADNGTVVGAWDASDTQLATTTTAAGGAYSFANLADGNYVVRIDLSNFGALGALSGLQGSSPNVPTDPDDNVDNDDNGAQPGGFGTEAYAGAITLAFNTEPTLDGTGQLDINTTLDFGFAATNDAPVFAGLDATPTFTENGAAVVLDGNATVSDPELTLANNFSGATLTLARQGGANTADVFEGSGTLALTGGNVLVGATTVGSFVQAAGTLTITFNGNATQALVNSVLQQLAYTNTNDDPTASVVIAYAFDDGNTGAQGLGGALSATGSITVSITPQDDAPVAQPDIVTTAENVVLTGGVGALFADNGSGVDSDVDGPALSIIAVDGVLANVGTQFTLASGALLTVNADGSYSYDPNGAFNYLISAATAAATGAVNDAEVDSFTYTLTGGNTVTVTVDVTGVNGAGDQLWGNSGNNAITGTGGNDYFNLSQGGDDIAIGSFGNDAFYFGAEFTAADIVDGGDGTNDQIGLEGDYTGANALVLAATSISNVEVIALLAGFDYDITTVDANVPLGGTLRVFATGLGAGDNFTFNGSAETNGMLLVYGGLGTDLITTGAGNDGVYFGPGRFDPLVDRVDGGTGTNDQLALDGDYTLTLESTAIQNIDVLALLQGKPADLADYNITVDDSLIGTGETFTIWGTVVATSLIVDGSAETDGDLSIYGGMVNDALTGGDGDDWIWGGLGADTIEGGLGADTFHYENAAQSSGAGFDLLIGVDATEDSIDLPFAVTGFAAGVANTLSFATLGGDLEAAVTVLGNHQAVLFTANAGDMSTRAFLIVDVNGTAGYQHGSDFLIEVNTAAPIEQVGMFI